jgi:hypothetical protein
MLQCQGALPRVNKAYPLIVILFDSARTRLRTSHPCIPISHADSFSLRPADYLHPARTVRIHVGTIASLPYPAFPSLSVEMLAHSSHAAKSLLASMVVVLVITCTGESIFSKGEGQKKGMKESSNRPRESSGTA